MAQLLTLRNGVPYLIDVPIGTPYDQEVVLSGAQTAPFTVTLPNSQTYTPGQNELQVFINGIAQAVNTDYTETSTTQITILKSTSANTRIRIRR